MANSISSLQKQASSQHHERRSGQRDDGTGSGFVLLPRTALCDEQRRQNVVRRHDIIRRDGRNQNRGLETAVAFRAAPKMADVPLIPILGSFGGNQLGYCTERISFQSLKNDGLLSSLL